MKLFLSPAETTAYAIEMGIKKASAKAGSVFILAFLAGAFIAFASEGSNMAAFNLLSEAHSYGLGKALAGAIFGTGLMLVVIAGGELFTGNTMLLGALASKKIALGSMLKNWLIVYLGNLAGSVFIAILMNLSGLFASGDALLGAMTIKIAAYKTGLDFVPAFVLGLLCNWLVCLAVWMAWSAQDVTGKILAIFFPIWLFITSGFEHSVANMYYIPAGIIASANPNYVALALEHGMTPQALEGLTWVGFFRDNLIPVTLGNIVGGGIFVMLAYWLAYGSKAKTNAS